MSFFFWPDEKIAKLIQLVKEQPVIWDRNNPHYQNIERKTAVWSKIGEAMNESDFKILREKFRRYREKYNHERRQINRIPQYKPVWRFYNAFKFVDNLPTDVDETAESNQQTIIRWSNEQTNTCIELYKSKPNLWNRSHIDFMNAQKRKNDFEDIAAKLNCPASVVRMKITSLRSKMYKEYSYLKHDKNYKPVWRFFEQLTFLKNNFTKLNYNLNEIQKNRKKERFWNDAKVLELISFLKISPQLWDRNDPDFLNRKQKDAIFEKIAKELGTTAHKTFLKINSLKKRYRKTRKNLQENKDYKSNFKYFKKLRFLDGESDCMDDIDDTNVENVDSDNGCDDENEFMNEERHIEATSDKLSDFVADESTMSSLPIQEIDDDASHNDISARWDDEKILKFLDLLKQNPLIYDKNAGEERTPEKNEIWQNIADELNDKSVEAVRREYKNLLRQCTTECLKGKLDLNYTNAWKFLPHAKFLCNAVHNCEEPEKEEAKSNKEIVHKPNYGETIPSANPKLVLWTDKKIIHFINVLQKYPIIWKHKDMKGLSRASVSDRSAIWEKMSQELGINVEVLRIKYTALRGRYTKEYKKAVVDTDYTPNWKFYSFLKFFPVAKVADFSSESSETDFSSDSSETDLSSDSSIAVVNECDSVEEQVEFETSVDDENNDIEHLNDFGVGNSSNFETEIMDISNNEMPTIKTEEIQIEAEKVTDPVIQQRLESRKTNKQKNDEYTAFAEYIANEMRKMKGNKLVELSFKSKVLRAILEANGALKKKS